MLTGNEKEAASPMVLGSGLNKRVWASRISWTGQTVASLCWIISVFVYAEGYLPTSIGDWLQLGAACAWLVANLFSLATADVE